MKKTYKHLVASFVLCTLFLGQARAQNMNFTQYPLAPAQSNPALIATSNQTNISFNHRNQFIGTGSVSYQSSMVSATMPWLQGGVDRKGAFGVTAFQDRTGENGIFTTTGLLGSVAYNHFLGNSTTGSRYLSIGLQGSFLQQKMNINAFKTGSQWNGSAFDPNLPINENVEVNQKTLGNFNAGLLYYASDTCDNVRSYIGITFQNINRPNASFVAGDKYKIPLHFSAIGGISVLNTDKIQIIPNARYLRNGQAQEIRAGVSGYYKVAGEEAKKVGASVWYDDNGSIAFAVEMNQPKYTVGFSYDMGITNPQTSLGAGAWELALAVKIGTKCKGARPIKPDDELIPDDSIQVEKHTPDGDSIYVLRGWKNKLGEIVRVDTLRRDFKPNNKLKIPTDEDLVIFKKTGYFFYRDDEINTNTSNLLTEMVEVLKRFKGLEIEVVGFSCNIGTEEENQTLSENRAKRVQKFFADAGIDTKRVKISGMGSKDPVMSNKMEYGRIKNRRVEFKVLRRGDEK